MRGGGTQHTTKGPRTSTVRTYVPGVKREKSGYSMFKCKFLSGKKDNWAWSFFDISVSSCNHDEPLKSTHSYSN